MVDVEAHDAHRRHCPKLGHELAFSYCREPGESKPCSRILDCWWEEFDVKAFVERHYETALLDELSRPPAPKTTTLLELIAQAQRRGKGG